MISEKAVEALCSEYFEKHGVSLDRANARAALSAALPLLLEGKREEIAREIEPEAFDNVAFARNWSQRHFPSAKGWWLPSGCERSLIRVQDAFARADRIISIMGGGE